MDVEEVGRHALDAAFKVHSALGPGLLESVYEAALGVEFQDRGIRHERQKEIPVEYAGRPLGMGFRADMIVEGLVLLELKSVETLLPADRRTTLTYLRLIPLQLGYLINFNHPLLKDGIVRIVNGLPESNRPRVVTRKGAQVLYRPDKAS